MATDEEILAAQRKAENKIEFNGMFIEAMDAWVEKQKEKQEEEPPKRTKQTGNGGFLDSLFGGA